MSGRARSAQQQGVAWVLLILLICSLVAVTGPLLTASVPSPGTITASMIAWLGFLLVFPSGRPEPRWAWVPAVLAAVGALLGQPLAFVAGFALLTVAQAWRYFRRSSLSERQSTKWLLLGLVPAAGVFLGVGLVAGLPGAPPGLLTGPTYEAASLAGMWAVPAAAAAGLLLGERGPVDELVRLVIAVTGAAFIVASVYVLALPLSTGWATVAACVIAAPALWACGQLGTALAYSRGPQRPLARLPHALAACAGPDEVAPTVAETVRRALAAPAAEVRVAGRTLAHAGAERPCPVELAVRLHGDEVAVLAACPRDGETTMARRDHRILEQVGVLAGPALAGVRASLVAEEASRHAETARDRERDRLHADLHDELGPALAGLTMTAAAISTTLDGDASPGLRRLLQELRLGINRTTIQVRELAYDLRPPTVARTDLAALLSERLQASPPPSVTITVELDGAELSDHLKIALVRVAGEAVTNVRRHASAHTCTVAVRAENSQIVVTVDDDGHGAADYVPGIGLASIRRRAQEYQGSASLTTLPDGGSRLRAVFVTPGRPR